MLASQDFCPEVPPMEVADWKGKGDAHAGLIAGGHDLKRYAELLAAVGREMSASKTSPAAPQEAELCFKGPHEAPPSAETPQQGRSHAKDLMATFGYPILTSKKPSFARFDVRDEACRRVSGFKHGQVVRDSSDVSGRELAVVGVKPDFETGEELIWVQALGCETPGALPFRPEGQGRLVAVLREKSEFIRKRAELRAAAPDDFEAAEDSDGEEMLLCGACHLPVGKAVYADEGGCPLHGECMAQRMVQETNVEEEQARRQEALEKEAIRTKHAIGWDTGRIPRNVASASKLACPMVGSMCCLVLQDSSKGVTVCAAPTPNPAACLNLEYFSLALKVRSLEGREPAFSLDPLAGPAEHLQVKRFEPDWLRGTSVGEVLFQSDYHLKELAMGERGQPVVGMRSCLDHSWEEGLGRQWHAREWFVVRKAEIQLSDDDVLMPCVRMGVEAREQVPAGGGLEDRPITRADHPLVRYAEDFTGSFDLIAERKSSIYHLRELAKASVLAKFVLESQVHLDTPWFSLAGEAGPEQPAEIPQLWNERRASQVQVRDGKIEPRKEIRRLYGGVEFGLDKFAISGRVGAGPAGAARPGFQALKLSPAQLRGAVAARRPVAAAKAPSVSVSLANLRTTFGVISSMAAVAPEKEAPAPAPGAPGAAVAAVSAPAAMPGMPRMMAPGVQVGPAPVKPSARMPASLVKQLSTPGGFPHFGGQDYGLSLPRAARVAGVDLNLDHFSLEEPVRVASEAAGGSWSGGNIACDFWAALDGDSDAVFEEGDKRLLRSIFKPSLSDRREEGDCFVPPDPTPSYMEMLRGLVEREEAVREQRTEHFLSSGFAAEAPGSVFPLSWVSSSRVAHGQQPQQPGSHLQARRDLVAQPGMFDLKSAAPVFDKATEEGLRFRMYRIGTLDVRTTQEQGGEEVIGMVYSVRPAEAGAGPASARDGSRIVKVTEYVEGAQEECAYFHSYAVLETAEGHLVVTEKLRDGAVAWEENPQDLEDRNSLAKCVRTWDCGQAKASVTVGDMKAYREAHAVSTGASHSKRKHYAQLVFNRVKGLESRAQSGFANKNMWSKSREAKNFQKEKLRFKKETERSARRAVARPAKVDKRVASPSVVGSWTNWEVAQAMTFDEARGAYTLDMKMGGAPSESFQILCNNDWDLCLHPDREDAHAHEAHALCGPDAEGNGKNWTIGLHKDDRAAKGVRYRIVLKVSAKGLAEKVEYERLGPGVLLA